MIRSVQIEDAKKILEIYGPYVSDSSISFETVLSSLKEIQERIAKTTKSYPWLVYEVDGEVVGYAYACEHRTRKAYQWSVDVAVYVSQSQHRRGIGKTLYQALFQKLRSQGFYNAYAGITLPNPSSIGLHESFGFTPVGVYRSVGFKNGKWHDVGWWQCKLQDHSEQPGNPAQPDSHGLSLLK